jgi:hypothetical protein
MKTLNKLVPTLLLFAIFSNCSDDEVVTPAPERNLIAKYPLANDGVDVTGNNGAMALTNTPFDKGGIYCNGKYLYSSDPDYCVAQSPPINSFNFKSFSISMDFYVAERMNQPVWIIGTSCRWLGFYLEADGTVSLLYNNANYVKSTKTYALNEWQKAQITYDGTTVEMFLGDNVACSMKFGNGYVPLEYASCGVDTEIGVTNYSNGQVLKGFVRNLEVSSIE